jgi:tetratricopeptide (TPR) repeat protein
MENHDLSKRLNATEALQLERIAQKIRFTKIETPLLGVFFSNTLSLQSIIQTWLCRQLEESSLSFQQLQCSLSEVFNYLETPTDILIIELNTIDNKDLIRLNSFRDLLLAQRSKVLFLCPDEYAQSWTDYAYDLVSRLSFRYNFHDLAVYDNTQEADLSKRDTEIDEIKVELEFLKNKKQWNEGDYIRNYQLAVQLHKLSSFGLSYELLNKAFPKKINKGITAAYYSLQALILQSWGRLEEAMILQKKEEKIKEELGDKQGLARSYGSQALILKAWGRLEEAMILHKKEEKIKEELGNKQGLAISYGNQALILSGWGRLEEAMILHKKEEKIEEELGNKQGLASSYGNQALILSAWGRLEEAMILHKKEEKIKEELGNKQGLASSYGNQALILSDWGRLEEAMILHKKEEKIKEELGNKQGLANTYGNQATILYSWNRLEEAIALSKKAEKIQKELGDKQGLANTYGNQALILKAWGRLEEAMVLHKKEEKIKEELGDKQGLYISYINQAVLLAEEFDRKKEALSLLQKALGLAEDLKATPHIEHIKGLIDEYK